MKRKSTKTVIREYNKQGKTPKRTIRFYVVSVIRNETGDTINYTETQNKKLAQDQFQNFIDNYPRPAFRVEAWWWEREETMMLMSILG